MALEHDLCPLLLPGVKLEKLPLTPPEGFVLSRVNGLAPVSQIIAETGMPAAQVEAALGKLELLGAIAFQKITAANPRSRSTAQPKGEVRAPAGPDVGIILERVALMYRSLGKIDHYKFLGVPRSAADEALKAAYAALSREIHPDRFFKMELGEKRDMLDTVFAKVSEAYDVLRDPAKRAAYDRSLLPPRPGSKPEQAAQPAHGKPSVTASSERIVMLAEQELRSGNYANAVRNFKIALALAPNDQDLAAKAAFAEGLHGLIVSLEKVNADPASAATILGDKGIGQMVSRVKKDREQFPADERLMVAAVTFLLRFDRDTQTARELAEKLARRAPRAGFYVLLGRVCEREGSIPEALRNFEKALNLEANNLEAKDAIRNLKRKS